MSLDTGIGPQLGPWFSGYARGSRIDGEQASDNQLDEPRTHWEQHDFEIVEEYVGLECRRKGRADCGVFCWVMCVAMIRGFLFAFLWI